MRIQPAAAARASRTSRSGSGLARTAYEVLHRRIMQGDFAPGEILSRRRIAAELGMSFLPASEAFLRLEWDGLLERRPRAGTRLRIPSRQDVEGHFVLCEALEAQAAMLFVEHSTQQERAALRKLAARVEARRIRQHCDPLAYAALHQEMHIRIAACARCDALLDAIATSLALSSAWLGAIEAPSTMGACESGPLPGCHRELLRALTSETPAAAAEAMRAHIRLNRDRLMQSLEPFFRLHEKYKKTFYRIAGKPAR
jgi:DNA-binding GntR family transcriptional regulator